MTSQPEFKDLFTNAVYHVWQNEGRHEPTLAAARERFVGTRSDLERVITDAQRRTERAQAFRLARHAIAFGLAGLACVLAYLYSFRRHGGTEVG